MGRILCIDYGLKKVGIAVTDTSLIIASPLITVENKNLFSFLDDYFKKEDVDKVVIGDPVVYGQESNIKNEINNFINIFKSKYKKEIVLFNERYTTEIAKYYLYNSNIKKKNRQDKTILDKMSASIILQSYLRTLKN